MYYTRLTGPSVSLGLLKAIFELTEKVYTEEVRIETNYGSDLQENILNYYQNFDWSIVSAGDVLVGYAAHTKSGTFICLMPNFKDTNVERFLSCSF